MGHDLSVLRVKAIRGRGEKCWRTREGSHGCWKFWESTRIACTAWRRGACRQAPSQKFESLRVASVAGDTGWRELCSCYENSWNEERDVRMNDDR